MTATNTLAIPPRSMQENALGNDLASERSASGTERGPNSELALPAAARAKSRFPRFAQARSRMQQRRAAEREQQEPRTFATVVRSVECPAPPGPCSLTGNRSL